MSRLFSWMSRKTATETMNIPVIESTKDKPKEKILSVECVKCGFVDHKTTLVPVMGQIIDGYEKEMGQYHLIKCPSCHAENSLINPWSKAQFYFTIPEDGTLRRFEVEYRDENGKKIQKKLDPHHMMSHLEKQEAKGTPKMGHTNLGDPKRKK
jgi:Zn ribbon nucleic-acid-binding protein